VTYRDSGKGQAEMQLDRIAFDCSCGTRVDIALGGPEFNYEGPAHAVTGGTIIFCPGCRRVFWLTGSELRETSDTYPDPPP